MQKYSLFTLSGLGSLSIFLFGGWDYLLMVLIACVALDYITGVLAAFVKKSLSSKVGFKGIAKKIFIFILVAVANFLDSLLWDNHLIRDATILFYVVNEIISITENAGVVGLPIPGPILKAIEQLKDRLK
ncbi:phage holin family protein [Metabacillus iocasae]|uniref:Toxin secretion/phage lysis holin n=1 Tax=Priestia iocasae TaxID=2291674 RepID=A0ABS2QZB6_9BACI|nr:phage holin family protein [Metabacillus iocasae]MBM7704833.1 toxin secretion/phage lysis holin [Metabacillus iocasae]